MADLAYTIDLGQCDMLRLGCVLCSWPRIPGMLRHHQTRLIGLIFRMQACIMPCPVRRGWWERGAISIRRGILRVGGYKLLPTIDAYACSSILYCMAMATAFRFHDATLSSYSKDNVHIFYYSSKR